MEQIPWKSQSISYFGQNLRRKLLGCLLTYLGGNWLWSHLFRVVERWPDADNVLKTNRLLLINLVLILCWDAIFFVMGLRLLLYPEKKAIALDKRVLSDEEKRKLSRWARSRSILLLIWICCLIVSFIWVKYVFAWRVATFLEFLFLLAYLAHTFVMQCPNCGYRLVYNSRLKKLYPDYCLNCGISFK